MIAGYTSRSDDPSAVGSLILAVPDTKGELRLAGKVGTGWDRPTARRLLDTLQALEIPEAALVSDTPAGREPRHGAGAARWVRPEHVAEVRFADWTAAGRIRHASFVALCRDEAARPLAHDSPAPMAGVTVSHPERVIDATSGRHRTGPGLVAPTPTTA